MISENNENAYGIMVDKYTPLIKKYASFYLKKYPNIRLDKDELIQEGTVGLINAVNSFQLNKNVIFYTFATLIIKREMARYIKNKLSFKNLMISSSYSLDEPLKDDDLFFSDVIYQDKDLVERQVISNSYEIILYNFKYELNDIQGQIYELRLNNFSNREISILLDIKYKSVDNSMRTIRNKLDNYLKRNIL